MGKLYIYWPGHVLLEDLQYSSDLSQEFRLASHTIKSGKGPAFLPVLEHAHGQSEAAILKYPKNIVKTWIFVTPLSHEVLHANGIKPVGLKIDDIQLPRGVTHNFIDGLVHS